MSRRGREHRTTPHRARPWRHLLGAVAVVAGGMVLHGVASTTTPVDAKPAAAWRWSLPDGFPTPRVPKTNPMTADKVAVGRRLFFDRRLSGNATQSCASCHRPELAFTDGRTVSIGSTGEPLHRNAPSLVNVAYPATLTWANPALVTLEKQMEVPLFGEHPVEMGVTDANQARILKRLRSDRWYAKRFRAAFPGQRTPIGWANIIKAISSFQRSIVSADSRYDRYLRNKAKLTPSEMRGLNLFMGERAECHHCHGTFIFDNQATWLGAPMSVPEFHNTGLYNLGGTGAYPEFNRGLFELTGKAEDMGKFRAPSLRNVEVTGPYMHDGSMKTLEEIVATYAAGGRIITEGPLAGDGRANPYKDPLIAQIELSARDQADLVAFLKTLTDRTVLKAERFSDPTP